MFSLKDYDRMAARSLHRKKPEQLAFWISASHKKSLATLSLLGSLGGTPCRRQARRGTKRKRVGCQAQSESALYSDTQVKMSLSETAFED
jgi:hypothetical protein